MSNINVIKGGICAVQGVRAAGTRQGKYGLTVIESKDSDGETNQIYEYEYTYYTASSEAGGQ